MVLTSHALQIDESVPQALKKYRLVGQLARGGMAELFLARANGIGGFERLLVIKRILPQLSRDPELVRMLLDEARTAATLQHSNIVQVFDVDMVDGNVFFAMEYLHGHHVLAMIDRARAAGTKIPIENAIAIAIAVAAGLHYAHERWGADGKPLGIVHRDVAPNNVIVTYDGNVKLIDFGIAKSANNLSTTKFGLFKGKLPYASPEQCRCEPVDRRTDVYSLGVLLYELTTGFPLFSAESEFELLRLMTEAIVPRPRMRDKTYPRELEQIVLKALAKDPAERYESAQHLQRDLEMFASTAHLDVSAFSLSRLMASLFGGELDKWKSAQNEGLTLEQHITKNTGSWPIEPSVTSAWALVAGPDGEDAPTLQPIRTAVPVSSTERVRRPVPRIPRGRAALLAIALVGGGAIVGRLVASAVRGDEHAAKPRIVLPAPAPIAPPTPIVTPLPDPPAAHDELVDHAPATQPAPSPMPHDELVDHAKPRTAKKHAAKRVDTGEHGAKRTAQPDTTKRAAPAADAAEHAKHAAQPVDTAAPTKAADDDLDAIVPRAKRSR